MNLRYAAVLVLAAASGCAWLGRSSAPAALASAPAQPAKPAEKKPHAVLTTSKGVIVIRLLVEEAPKTTANFIELATGKKQWTDPRTDRLTQRPLYNGTIFHRVIPDYLIQGGDPSGTGKRGPGLTLEAEVTPTLNFDRAGVVAMVNDGKQPNASQFFITLEPAPWLNGKNNIFGEVVEGQDVVEAISKLPRSADGLDRPIEPVKLNEVRIDYRP